MFSDNFLLRAASSSPASCIWLHGSHLTEGPITWEVSHRSPSAVSTCSPLWWPALSWPTQTFFPLPGRVYAHLLGDKVPSVGPESWLGLILIPFVIPVTVTVRNSKTYLSRVVLKSSPPEPSQAQLWEGTPWDCAGRCVSAPVPGGALSLDKAGSLGSSISGPSPSCVSLNSLCMAPSACIEIYIGKSLRKSVTLIRNVLQVQCPEWLCLFRVTVLILFQVYCELWRCFPLCLGH